MNKTIDDYMELPYTIELTPEAQGGWFVGIKELPGCMTDAETQQEALREIREIQREWLQIAMEEGLPIPEPRPEEEFSGKFNLRVPRSLHRQLSEMAEKEGISLNAYCNSALAKEIGRTRASQSHPSGAAEGLLSAISRLCSVVDLEQVEGKSAEESFSGWFQAEINEVFDLYQSGNPREALNNLSYITRLLRKIGKASPFLCTLSELMARLDQVLEAPEHISPQSRAVDTGLGEVIVQVNKTIIRRTSSSARLEDRQLANKSFLDTPAAVQFEHIAREGLSKRR